METERVLFMFMRHSFLMAALLTLELTVTQYPWRREVSAHTVHTC
jgi:hypothetical protein